jgi:AcrR family transcriptional regulator
MPRPYELKRRAQLQEETRRRIVDAAVELHQTLGPVATTISDIAARAGVGRVTVYRHFPDEPALLRACSEHYFGQHPFPDLETWEAIADPEQRLRTGLRDTYAYHAATHEMQARVLRDKGDDPVMAPYHEHWERAVDVLVDGAGTRGRRRKELRAGIALALGFETWRTLVLDGGLDNDQAASVAARLAGPGQAATAPGGRPRS